MVSRRQVVKLAAATPFILGTRTVLASSETRKDRIARIIREYSEQGIHRSGTIGDLANSAAAVSPDIGLQSSDEQALSIWSKQIAG